MRRYMKAAPSSSSSVTWAGRPVAEALFGMLKLKQIFEANIRSFKSAMIHSARNDPALPLFARDDFHFRHLRSPFT